MNTLLATPAAPPRTCDLSVIVVNYRSLELLEQCLGTWHEAVAGMNVELHVIENGTDEPVRESLRTLLPEAKVVVLGTSIGFSAAVNRALRDTSGRHVAILNPDTLLAPRSLSRLAAYLDEHADVGIVGPRVWDDSGRTSIQRSWRRFPGVLTSLFNRNSVLSRVWPGNPWTRAYLNHDRSPDEVQDTDWVSGCCMVIRGSFLRSLGGLDQRYPMFCEDVDICRTAGAHGLRVVYDPRSEIVHFIGGSRSKARLRSTWLRHRSMTQYVCKFNGVLNPLTWVYVAGIWSRFALHVLWKGGTD